MSLITLGGVVFGDFEIPGQVRFGGAQQLAVHRLIGGARVIDAMGRNDSVVQWSGVFSGADAGRRARMLDAMRAAGQASSLSWDAFSYSVVIERLEMEYCSPWWIPYRIACTVVIDQAQNVPFYNKDLEDALTNDLNNAAAFVNVSSALAEVGVSGALTQGNADYTAASVALAGASATVDQGIASVASQLESNNLGLLVSASGSLAQLCVARGYVRRAASNLEEAGI